MDDRITGESIKAIAIDLGGFVGFEAATCGEADYGCDVFVTFTKNSTDDDRPDYIIVRCEKRILRLISNDAERIRRYVSTQMEITSIVTDVVRGAQREATCHASCA